MIGSPVFTAVPAAASILNTLPGTEAFTSTEPAPAAGAAAGAAAEEKTDFDVVLTTAGDAKLKVVKVLKDSIGLGLKEAKDMADNVPSTIKAGCPKDEAEKIKAALEELGATVELK